MRHNQADAATKKCTQAQISQMQAQMQIKHFTSGHMWMQEKPCQCQFHKTNNIDKEDK